MTRHTPGRVAKRPSASRNHTKQRSRLGGETSAADAVSLQRMVDEATYGLQGSHEESDAGASQRNGKQKSQERDESSDYKQQHPEFEDRPFPLMSLPAEIRNEIYRACLTRPFNILLSRREPPLLVAASEACEQDEETARHILDISDDETPPSSSAPGRLLRSSGRLARLDLPRTPFQLQRSAPVRFNTRSGSSTTSSSGSSDSSVSSLNINLPRQSSANVSQRSRTNDFIRARRPQDEDPLLVGILRVSKQVYQEARSILYNENCFTLDLETALPTLAALHQRSRRQIKYVELEIPCYNEILERFQECVRLSLRYCWGLKTFVIHMPFTLPGADGSGTTGNTTVYANGFDILRWLPRQCEVVLKGNICTEISAVVNRNANLARILDEYAYARRQLISNETERS